MDKRVCDDDAFVRAEDLRRDSDRIRKAAESKEREAERLRLIVDPQVRR